MEVRGREREGAITEVKKSIFKKEELSIVSNIPKKPTDNVSVGFGDMEVIGDPEGSLFHVMAMEARALV